MYYQEVGNAKKLTGKEKLIAMGIYSIDDIKKAKRGERTFILQKVVEAIDEVVSENIKTGAENISCNVVGREIKDKIIQKI